MYKLRETSFSFAAVFLRRSSTKCSVNSLIQMKSLIYSNSQVGYAVRRPSYYTFYKRNKAVKHSLFFRIL